MTGTVALVLRAAGLLLHVAIWALAQWGRLCVGVPMRVWWWIWRRPLPLWRRVHFAVAPWLLFGLAAAPWMYVEHLRREDPLPTPALRAAFLVAYPVVRLEREAIASVVTGVQAFASPWEPAPESGSARAARPTRSRSLKRATRPPAEILARQIAIVLLAFVGLPSTVLLVFGGPVLVPVLVIMRGRGCRSPASRGRGRRFSPGTRGHLLARDMGTPQGMGWP